jgi:hypothetical protein
MNGRFAKSLNDVPVDLRTYVSDQASLAYNLGCAIAVWIENGKAYVKTAFYPYLNGNSNPRNFIR